MYAIVENGVVVNTVVWDGNSDLWKPPTGAVAVQVTDETGPAYIGFAYTDGRFATPPAPQDVA